MSNKEVDVVIVPSTEKQMIDAKLWMMSAGIRFEIGSVNKHGTSEKQILFFTKMTPRQRILMRETIGMKFELGYMFG